MVFFSILLSIIIYYVENIIFSLNNELNEIKTMSCKQVKYLVYYFHFLKGFTNYKVRCPKQRSVVLSVERTYVRETLTRRLWSVQEGMKINYWSFKLILWNI